MAETVRRADFIFVMTYGHLDSMLLLFPSAAEKTFLLREFETDLAVMEREVSDPIGQSKETYRECRDQIREALPRLLDLVLRSTHDETGVTARKKIALAADTDGIELKEQVRSWLDQNGHPFEDLGDARRMKWPRASLWRSPGGRPTAASSSTGPASA